jgi:hypothetical protein
MSLSTNLRAALLCEDVRLEQGGKFTIVGVFANDIIVSQFPANLSLSAFIEYIPPKAGPFELRYSFLAGDKLLAHMRGDLFVNEPGTVAALYLPRINVTLAGEAELRLEMAIGNEPPETIIRRRVMLAQPNSQQT